MKDEYIQSKNGQKKLCQTMVGWYFKVEWNEGQEQWMPLKILKESIPVEIAKYVTARDLADEPAFAWWVLTLYARKKG